MQPNAMQLEMEGADGLVGPDFCQIAREVWVEWQPVPGAGCPREEARSHLFAIQMGLCLWRGMESTGCGLTGVLEAAYVQAPKETNLGGQLESSQEL